MGISARYSTRNAILEAYSIEMQGSSGFESAGGRTSTSTTHKLASKYEAAKIIAAVENQPDLKAWLVWAYGPIVMASARSIQESAAGRVAGGVVLNSSHTPAAKLRAELLIWLHMENYRARAITNCSKYRKPAHFDAAMRRLTCGQVGINLANYRRDFQYLEEQVWDCCADLDRRGLGKVGQALRNIWYERGSPEELFVSAPFARAS